MAFTSSIHVRYNSAFPITLLTKIQKYIRKLSWISIKNGSTTKKMCQCISAGRAGEQESEPEPEPVGAGCFWHLGAGAA